MLVTVAIPTYNGEDFIEETIKGIIQQSFTDFEILIIDDNSKDNTISLIEQYRDNRIRIIKNKKHLGGYKNFNKCFLEGLGKYIFINHQDDIMLPECLKKAIEILELDSSISCVGINSLIIDEDGKKYNPSFNYTEKDILFTRNDFIDSFFKRYTMAISSVLFRKEIISKNKLLFNPQDGECADIIFWLRIGLCSEKIYFIHDPLFLRRIHSKQWSHHFFQTPEHICDYILKTGLKQLELILSSDVIKEKKGYIQLTLNHVLYLLFKLPASQREQVEKKFRKRIEPLFLKEKISLSKTGLICY